MDRFQESINEYITFKQNIKVASSQMLRMMSKMEIEMISKDILSFLSKKYKLDYLPEEKKICEILEQTFSNSIIRSEFEMNKFLQTIDNNYDNLTSKQVISTIEDELKKLKETVKNIYDVKTTSCYSDFARRCTEDITRELRSLNQTEEFENNIIKMKMQLKKELSGVLQKFLDGAYKMINTQIVMKMQKQIELLKNSQ